MMSLNVRDSAIHLFRGGVAVKSIYASRDFNDEKRLSLPRKPRNRVDFSSIHCSSDAIRSLRELASMSPEPSIRVYNNLLSDIAKKELYSVALDVFDEMRHLGVAADSYTMSIVINCCSLLKRVDVGFAVLGVFIKNGYEPNGAAFNTLLKGLFLADEIGEAEFLFKKILSFKPCVIDDVMILTVVNGLSKAGKSLTARDLLLALDEAGYKPNVRAYNAVIDGLSKRGMVDDALLLLSEMVEKGVSPNVVTCNALIDGYCSEGEMVRARELFDSMAKMGIKHNIFIYNTLIKGYCKMGNLDEALRFFDEIPRVGLKHSIVSYSTMMHRLICHGRFSDGWKLFEDMEAQKLHPNVHTYTILLDGLCRNHRIDEALAFLRVMEKKGLNPNIVTYGVLINGLCKGGRLDEAMSLFHHLPSKGLNPDAKIYNMMLDSLYHQGRLVEAKRLMERSRCSPNGATYNIIVWNLMKRNKVYEAIPFLEDMCRRGFQVNSANMSILLHRLRGGKGKDEKLRDILKKLCAKNSQVKVLFLRQN